MAKGKTTKTKSDRRRKAGRLAGQAAAGAGGAIAANFAASSGLHRTLGRRSGNKLQAGGTAAAYFRAGKQMRAAKHASTLAGAAAGVAAYNARHRKSGGSGRGRQRRDRHGRFA